MLAYTVYKMSKVAMGKRLSAFQGDKGRGYAGKKSVSNKIGGVPCILERYEEVVTRTRTRVRGYIRDFIYSWYQQAV